MEKSVKLEKREIIISLKKTVVSIFGIIVGLLVIGLVTVFLARKAFYNFIEATADNVSSHYAASCLQEGSDYLTEQLRLFVYTEDVTFMNNYFKELKVTRRRESALDVIKKYDIGENFVQSMQNVLKISDKLALYERYAIKLVVVALSEEGQDFPIPEEIRKMRLTEADQALSPVEKKSNARKMVFDLYYVSTKAEIEENRYSALNDLVIDADSRIVSDRIYLQKMVVISTFVLVAILVLAFFIVFIVLLCVLRPLGHFLRNVKEEKPLEELGPTEFRYFASVYNDLWKINAQNQNNLKHEAEHDELTGLINRRYFSHLRHALEYGESPVALLIIDVDEFKHVNDTYGHETGDAVLVRVSKVLSDFFRMTDFVARIGGDEFSVIMTKFGDDIESVIGGKLERMRDALKDPLDGVPGVTLSVGIAFAREGFPENLFQHADKALYRVKRNGRNGYAFYDEIIDSI